jgi:hypothetical protein
MPGSDPARPGRGSGPAPPRSGPARGVILSSIVDVNIGHLAISLLRYRLSLLRI